uniref:Uncharacterized protein n=1 Tax=Cacopsylla melanoneura TaxID=428564 RepID=A0A8D8ZV95_9HEMI
MRSRSISAVYFSTISCLCLFVFAVNMFRITFSSVPSPFIPARSAAASSDGLNGAVVGLMVGSLFWKLNFCILKINFTCLLLNLLVISLEICQFGCTYLHLKNKIYF